MLPVIDDWEGMEGPPIERDIESALRQFPYSNIHSKEDVEQIYELGGRLTKEWSWSQFSPTEPWLVKQYIEDIAFQTDKRGSFFDIGFGTGYMIAIFASLGFKTYGNDISEKVFGHCMSYFDKIQKRFGEFRYQPMLERCDIEDKCFAELRFRDGHMASDSEIFYCHIGDNQYFHKEIISSMDTKPGSIWLDYYIGYIRVHEMDNGLNDTRFRPISNHLHSLLVSD